MASSSGKSKEGQLPKRERTRRALIAAAAELIGERGYEAVSLEMVARRAGMSRGAIYGNFADRDALFLAVAAALWKPVSPVTGAASPRETLRAYGRAVAAEARARRDRAVGALSFQIYALKTPELRRRLVAANAAIYREAAARLTADAKGTSLPASADHVVKAAHALAEGLMLTHFLTPELLDEEAIVAAFDLLAVALPDRA